MSAKLTKEEREFIERVRPLLKNFLQMCHREGIELGAGSYVLSERDNVYHGVPFDAARCIHGEENAIGTMLTEEGAKAKLKIIFIVGSPKDVIMPCGMCREAINRHSMQNASVLCANLSLSKVKRFTISELYPHPCQGES
jgi:cytidine deaminase